VNRRQFALLVVFLAAGCSRPEWEVTVENKSDVPCSVVVSMRGGSSSASVDDLEKGKAIAIVGGAGATIINTVKVTRGKDEKLLTPDAKLAAGQRYAIVVTADGNVETAILDR
jgi:hypothetical protein